MSIKESWHPNQQQQMDHILFESGGCSSSKTINMISNRSTIHTRIMTLPGLAARQSNFSKFARQWNPRYFCLCYANTEFIIIKAKDWRTLTSESLQVSFLNALTMNRNPVPDSPCQLIMIHDSPSIEFRQATDS